MSSTGAKVIVHRQDEYPFIEDVGTEIETAMATSIGMRLVRECSGFRRLGEVPLREGALVSEGGVGRACLLPRATGAATLKAVFVSSVWVGKDRKELKEPSLCQRQTSALVELPAGSERQAPSPYLSGM